MVYHKILVFAGAGASAPFGVPVMQRMTSLLEERSSGLPQHLRSVLGPLSAALREIYRDEYDLEKLLDVVHDLALGISAESSIRDSSPHAAFRYHEVVSRASPSLIPVIEMLDDQYRSGQTYAELERAISAQIADWCEELDVGASTKAWTDFLGALPSGLLDGRGSGIPTQPRHLPGLGRSIPLVTLATTNYDLALERFLASGRAQAQTGFRFNPQTNIEEFELGPPEGEGFPLLKLHGSIDWWKTDDHRTVRVLGGKVSMNLKDGAKIIARELRYPVVTKSLGGVPFSSLYSRLAEAMAAASAWIFIGYSFGDQSIIELAGSLLGTEKRLVIVSPHASALDIRTKIPAGSGPVNLVDAAFGADDLMTRINAAIHRETALA